MASEGMITKDLLRSAYRSQRTEDCGFLFDSDYSITREREKREETKAVREHDVYKTRQKCRIMPESMVRLCVRVWKLMRRGKDEAE